MTSETLRCEVFADKLGALNIGVEVEHVFLLDAPYYEVPFAIVPNMRHINCRFMGNGLGAFIVPIHQPIHINDKIVIAHPDGECSIDRKLDA